MLWTSNICRICARISEICIPIFEEDADPGVDSKIRRCLSSTVSFLQKVSKDDLKPKQVCQDCYVKLNEFYNFIALYHESNYRFETLIYQSTQNAAGTLPTQDCVSRSVDLDLSIVAPEESNLIATKTEDLPDCTSLGLIVEYKDDMLPLQNLDVHARDFGEQNILNEIVEQANVNNEVDIDMQNFVTNNDNQIYSEISDSDDTQNLTMLRNSNDHNYLGKLRSLHSYLNSQDVEINLVNSANQDNLITKSSDTGSLSIQNSSYNQNVYAENVLINNSNIKLKGNVNVKKRNSKLNTISVETIRKAVESEKQAKFEVTQRKPRLNRPRKINNNSVYKTKALGNLETRDFGEQNILNEIANQTNVVDIDNIDVQNLVATSDNQIYGEIGDNLMILKNHSNLSKINNITPFVDVQQSIVEPIKCEKNLPINTKNCTDPLALDYATYTQNFYTENIECNKSKVKINATPKKRNKINIIAVKTIRKQLQNEPTPKRSKLNKNKDPNDNSQSKSRLTKPKEPDENGKIKRFPCSSCEKSFVRRQHLNEHIKKHNSVRPYVCDVCDKTFAIQWDLTFHKRVHTNLYSCQHCAKCFSAPSKLQRHVRTHTGERPFVCTVKDCGRSFSDKRNLIGHQITHTNVRKFTCDICKRSYKTKSQVKDHMQAHSESPAFKCDDCGKSYRWKTNLLIHMKKHNGYECDNCKVNCGKRSLLIKHRKECKKEATGS